MKTKIIATILALGMVLTAFSMFAAAGTPEITNSRVANNADGTTCTLVGPTANGISYFWEVAEAFNPSVTVATCGVNSKGIAIDGTGAWTYNIAYGGASLDSGSVWDAWATGEMAVQVYEVFNDQSTTGRNYTHIYEQLMAGTGTTNFGGGASPVAPNILTPINIPTLVSKDAGTDTAIIQIADQTTGFENAALFDGYRVFKSANPITQSNQGTPLGDAVDGGAFWTYTDTAWTASAYYAVKVKWDGGSLGAFIAPLYSYGMSTDLFVEDAVVTNTNAVVTAFAIETGNLLLGNHNDQTVTLGATISDAANEGDLIAGAEISVNGGAWVAMTPVNALDTATESFTYVYTAPAGYYPVGTINYQVRGWDNAAVQGALTPSADSFAIVDSTLPTVAVNSAPTAIYTTQPANFNFGYEDFTAYNTNVLNTYIRWRLNLGAYTNYALTNASFMWGSYMNMFTYSIPGNTFVDGDIIDWNAQITDSNGNVGILAGGSITVSDAPAGVQDPYPIYGYLNLYNGNALTYTPVISPAGTVVTATWISSFNGAVLTRTDTTNALGQFSIDLMNYTNGAQVWLTATWTATGNAGYNYTTIDIAAFPGGRMQNVLCGIPYNVEITVPLLNAIETPGVAFTATYVWYDINGVICQGYYTFADGPMIWYSGDTLFVPPAAYSFNGLVDAGTHNDLLTLFTSGIQYINISENGAAGVNPYPTPWGAIQIPTTFVAGNVVLVNGYLKDWDNSTVMLISGGFQWNVVVGWNMVSIPQDPVNKGTNGIFDSFDALNYIRWQLGYTNNLALADRTGGNPSTYNMFDYGMAEGVAFPMDGVHAYWVWSDTAGVCQFNSTNYTNWGVGNVLNAGAGWNLVGFTHNYTVTAGGWAPLLASEWTTGAVSATLAGIDKIVVTEWLEAAAPQWYHSYVDSAAFPGMATHNWGWDFTYGNNPGNGCFLWLQAPAVITFNTDY